ncbi:MULTISPECIES: hypothetical protein [Modicisalibacter]|uniref:hypothetical protein n=1 Tax=Modicisalibacter TaxID=574347 RepID=UPI00100A46A0|nr:MULTISPECIES: hypothetical protein [Halomonadaceae]MBZ9557394.1 hypothetical protein [Modicisalibacter sp. R2A 31.J]MBZ9573940.1 hypothetical protein [Modicisalibacter sp. MOD 31.J]
MALYLLIFAVTLVVLGGSIALLMMARTPRYRTEPQHLLRLFDRVLEGKVSESEWHTVVGYPVRHDEYLEGVRRSAQQIMDEHGRPWQLAHGGSLLSRTGREELATLRDHLASHTALEEGRREF